MDDLFDGLDIESIKPALPITGTQQHALDELDAIPSPSTDAVPVVAEFAVSPATREAIAALPAGELQELEEALADFDLYGDDPQPTATPTGDAVATTRDELIADAKANGWTAKAFDAIDAYRAGPGNRDYKLTRKLDRHEKHRAEHGHYPRAYAVPDGPEKQARRNEQLKAAQQRQRAKMTPDEKRATNAARSERRRLQRERAKAETASTQNDLAQF